MSTQTREAPSFRGGRRSPFGNAESSTALIQAGSSMLDRRRVIQATIAGLLLTTSIAPPVSAETCLTPQPQSPILCSYVYGFAPIVMEVTREIETAVPDATTVMGAAPINQLARVKGLATPAERLVVRPNADTLYNNAWLDLSYEPMILHLPDTGGRYYLMPMLDAYSNVFASLGARTTGTGAGDYAIVGPNWNGTLPSTLAGVVHAPTNTVWLIGRTLVRGPSDLADAVTVTNQYQLMPLTAYPQFLLTGIYTPPANVPVTPPNSDFAKPPFPGFSTPEFFDELLKISLKNPPPPEQEPLAALLVGEGVLLKSLVTQDVEKQAFSAFAVESKTDGTTMNGWTANLHGGNYGVHYLQRAATARFGLGQNIPQDAVYYATQTDINSNPLSPANSYVIHFTPDQIPQVSGFWSVTVYDGNGFLVANSIKRYSLGSESGLAANADGSIDILLQNTPPATLQSNWLPTPIPNANDPASQSFNLTLRLFWPGDTILNGAYTPPTVSTAAAAQLAGQ